MADYTTPLQQLLRDHNVNPELGLPSAKARGLLEIHGENKLRGKKHRNYAQKFLDQMKDYMVLILLAAAVISFVIALLSHEGEFIDSIIILAIVVLNGILGVQQESKAEKALDALQDMSAPMAKVLRDGAVCVIPSA